MLHFFNIERLITYCMPTHSEPWWIFRNNDLLSDDSQLKWFKLEQEKDEMDLYFVPPSCSPTNKYLRFTVGTKPSPSMSCNRVTWVIENTKRKLAMSSCIPIIFSNRWFFGFHRRSKIHRFIESIHWQMHFNLLMKGRYCNKACIFPNCLDFMY